jgi:hypothetical protein
VGLFDSTFCDSGYPCSDIRTSEKDTGHVGPSVEHPRLGLLRLVRYSPGLPEVRISIKSHSLKRSPVMTNVNNLQNCPRCGGSGVDPEQSEKPTPSGQVSADKCRQCGGTGRVPHYLDPNQVQPDRSKVVRNRSKAFSGPRTDDLGF